MTPHEQAFVHLTNADSHLASIIGKVQLLPTNTSGDVYYALLEAIVSQQLSVKVADVIFGRFIALFPTKYPKPVLLLELSVETLRSVGLSNQKAVYLQNVATFFEENTTIHWEELADEEIIATLTKIKGVGRWTVEMILMFTLQRPDVFPVGDLGIQQGMMKIYGLEKDKALHQNMTQIAEAWRPFRTVASKLIWRWKDTVAK